MLVFLSSVLLLSHTLASTNTTTTYDTFKLVRQWYPNSCYKASPPCISLPRVVKYWTIHGLWPSKRGSTDPAYCAGSSCHLNVSWLPDLVDMMHQRWPTYESGGDAQFWKHEYCKHGTCCTDVFPDVHHYFSAALTLNHHLDVDTALAKAGILPDLNKPYSFTQLDSAMKSSFGVDEATYWCRFVKEDDGSSRQLVFQISVCIAKDSASLNTQNCPAPGKSCVITKPFYLLPFSVLRD